jgi:hypothetical protein
MVYYIHAASHVVLRLLNKHNQHTKRAFYISPKSLSNSAPNDIGVIGGSFIRDANYKTPNSEEFEHIIKNAKSFYGLD